MKRLMSDTARTFALHTLLILLFLPAQTVFATSEPAVATLLAQSVSADSAVLRGAITDGEGAPEILERRIEWTPTPAFGASHQFDQLSGRILQQLQRCNSSHELH